MKTKTATAPKTKVSVKTRAEQPKRKTRRLAELDQLKVVQGPEGAIRTSMKVTRKIVGRPQRSNVPTSMSFSLHDDPKRVVLMRDLAGCDSTAGGLRDPFTTDAKPFVPELRPACPKPETTVASEPVEEKIADAEDPPVVLTRWERTVRAIRLFWNGGDL